MRSMQSEKLFHGAYLLGKKLTTQFADYSVVWELHASACFHSDRLLESFDSYCYMLDRFDIESDDVTKNLDRNISHIIGKIKDTLYKRHEAYPSHIIRSIGNGGDDDDGVVTFTITTCKRLDLFKRTMNSFLECCTDIQFIKRWICVDDNSSDSDRMEMSKLYPFLEFVFKTEDQKGHAESMNILRNMVKTPYVLHLEDDWHFIRKAPYISRCMAVLKENDHYGQCLFNQNYSETELDIDLSGGFLRKTTLNKVPYSLHEFYSTGEQLRSRFGTQRHCGYWPHYSLRPSLLKTEVWKSIGPYNPSAPHFEWEYAQRYIKQQFVSTFLRGIYCIHIGKLTSEKGENAYTLNGQSQFGIKRTTTTPSTTTTSTTTTIPSPLSNTGSTSSGSDSNTLEISYEFDRPVKTFVVNLQRREDRWTKFKELTTTNLEFLSPQRFNAIDGKKIDTNSDTRVRRLFRNNDYNWRCGLMGCALSHVNLWLKLMNEKEDDTMYIILEDDVTFTPSFRKKLMVTYHQLKDHENWDLLYLGHTLRKRTTNHFRNDVYPSIVSANSEMSLKLSMGGTFAYMITKRAASKLIYMLNSTGMRKGIDTMMQLFSDVLDVYYTIPHLVYSDLCSPNRSSSSSVDTDIQNDYTSNRPDTTKAVECDMSRFTTMGLRCTKVTQIKDGIISSEHDIIFFMGTPKTVDIIHDIHRNTSYRIGDEVLVIINPNSMIIHGPLSPTEFTKLSSPSL